MGLAAVQRGDLSGGLAYAWEAYARQRIVLGDHHQDTLFSLLQIGITERVLGRPGALETISAARSGCRNCSAPCTTSVAGVGEPGDGASTAPGAARPGLDDQPPPAQVLKREDIQLEDARCSERDKLVIRDSDRHRPAPGELLALNVHDIEQGGHGWCRG